MGVKSIVTLKEVQDFFPKFNITSIQATSDGVVDTTYVLNNYILKKYERNIKNRILQDKILLESLQKHGIPVPLCLAESQEWYLYEKLQGKSPKNIKLFHIQSLARIMAKLHAQTIHFKEHQDFLAHYSLKEYLSFTKQKFFFYYKKFQALQEYTMQKDGFIHGDIFTDNTLFEGQKISLFDFIDSGLGSFVFDIAVALVSFNPSKKKSYTQLFLQTYNQCAPKKVSLQKLEKEIQTAAQFYGLLRIVESKKTKKTKQLANLW